MRSHWYLLFLALTTVQFHVHAQVPITQRLDQQEAALNRLTAKLSDLNDQFDTLTANRQKDEDSLTRSKWYLEDKFGDGCPKDQFACGGNTIQCVSDLLVCNGDNDCQNGYDESDEVCTVPFKLGANFTGFVIYNNCDPNVAGNTYDSWIITKLDRVPFFPTVSKLSWTYWPTITTKTYTQTSNTIGEGIFYYAKRRQRTDYRSGNMISGFCAPMGTNRNSFVCKGYRSSFLEEGEPCYLQYYVVS